MVELKFNDNRLYFGYPISHSEYKNIRDIEYNFYIN